VAKLAYTELDVALTETALDLIASSVSLDEGGAEVADRWHHNFLWGRALTISGGSSAIMRGLVGRQLLGLPRA
jgi:alkylation response protein AidB-like acyl-CoA dehydrogenase